jgi:hypothetical protein
MHNLTDTQKVIATIERMYNDGNFAFRGHECFKFDLIPSAFRLSTINQMKRLFNIDTRIIDSWYKSGEIKKQIDLWAPGADHNHNAMITINRLLDYCLYLMILNHSVNDFAQNNISRISEKDRQMLQLRNVEFWKDEKTFHYMFSSYFQQIVQIRDLNGALIKDANPYEDLTGIDESLPQHYGASTAALDWTYNPFVALFFALGNRSVASGFLTLNALNIQSNAVDSPIKFIDKSVHIENLRAERQEGTFTYFTKPCSFFLKHGALPSINYFDNRYKNGLEKPRFELHEFRIERSNKNINYIGDMLDEAGINEEFLFPDKEEVIA